MTFTPDLPACLRLKFSSGTAAQRNKRRTNTPLSVIFAITSEGGEPAERSAFGTSAHNPPDVIAGLRSTCPSGLRRYAFADVWLPGYRGGSPVPGYAAMAPENRWSSPSG